MFARYPNSQFVYQLLLVHADVVIDRFGAVCPWSSFLHNDVIPIYRLIFLGILILLFRRLPVVFALHWNIWQIEQKQQAIFVGFFGPIGVSAVFYLYISLEFLRNITVDGMVREDAQRLVDIFTVVIWFLAMCSIVRLVYQELLSNTLTYEYLDCSRAFYSNRQIRLSSTSHSI